LKDYVTNDIQILSLERELTKQEAKQGDFLSFIYYINTDYKANWHHRIIIKELQNFLSDPTKKNLAVFVPPQHGKSEITSRLFPAYALGVNPNLKIAVSSYSSDLADSFNRDIQKYIDLPEYFEIFPETQLNSRNVVTTQSWLRNSEVFEIVGKKGFLKSVGVGGGLTGRAVDIAIIDDPVKDDQEAQSPTFRDRVWQWYITVLSTRLHNASKQILIMTRWHEDDLAGRLLNPLTNPNYKDWKVISLPAIKEDNENPNDPREIGEALWPQRHSLDKMLKLKALNENSFLSLYQQNPTPKEGNKVKSEWFSYVDSIPNLVKDIWIDGSYGDNTKADPTGMIITMFDRAKQTLYICHAFDDIMQMPELLTHIEKYVVSHGLTPSSRGFIEPKASGKSIKQLINPKSKISFVDIISYLVKGKKEERLQVAANYIESGKVKFLRGHWNDRLRLQLTGFPKVKNDEYVDLMGYACEYYFRTNQLIGVIGMGNLQ